MGGWALVVGFSCEVEAQSRDFNCIRATESGERGHAVCIIITEQNRLNARAPLRDLASSDIVFVTRGVTLCIGYHGGQIVRGIVSCRSYISGCICRRGGHVVTTIRSGLTHPLCRITASVGGRYSGVIRLRERKAVHRHGFCCDVAGGQGVVGLALRSNMILYPLRRSQVSFVNC